MEEQERLEQEEKAKKEAAFLENNFWRTENQYKLEDLLDDYD